MSGPSDVVPLLADQSWFSIMMTTTVRIPGPVAAAGPGGMSNVVATIAAEPRMARSRRGRRSRDRAAGIGRPQLCWMTARGLDDHNAPRLHRKNAEVVLSKLSRRLYGLGVGGSVDVR